MSDAAGKIIAFYDEHINTFGSGPRAVGWSDVQSQEVRFSALCGLGDFNNASVLDVGCGLGDFYQYLNDRYKGVHYTGIDINPRYIENAKKLYAGAHFEVADFGEYVGGPFDYVCASGLFSVKIPNYKEVYGKQIEKMFAIARKGIAFTMLDEKHHANDESYAAYSVEEVRARCLLLTKNVVIDQGYLPHDFTVIVKRN